MKIEKTPSDVFGAVQISVSPSFPLIDAPIVSRVGLLRRDKSSALIGTLKVSRRFGNLSPCSPLGASVLAVIVDFTKLN